MARWRRILAAPGWLALGTILAGGLTDAWAEPTARRPGTVLFKLKPNANPSAVASLLNSLSRYRATDLSQPIQTARLFHDCFLNVAFCDTRHTEESLCQRLVASGAVQFAQPDYVVEPSDVVPNDPGFAFQWWQGNIGTPAAWARTTGDHSILVGICDSGFSVEHPDLAQNFVLPGYNVVDGSTVVTPEYSHGTCVAGVIGAIGDNAQGVVGVAWRVSMLPIKVANPVLGGGRAYISDIVAGIVHAANQGARIVNVSFDAAGSDAVHQAALYLRSRGGLLVVAAGNEDLDPRYPDYPSFLAVGATGSGPIEDRHMPSHTGGFIDLVAPGDALYTTGDNEPYTYFSGTSAAAPVVSGVAALIYSAQPWFAPSQVEVILRQSCLDLGFPGEDLEFGSGRVSASAAIDMAVGDLNGDKRVNQGDYAAFRSALGSSAGQSQYNPLADYDGDRRVTYSDYTLWYRCCRGN